jgi:hypothetical protein
MTEEILGIDFVASRDTDTHRVCSTCDELLPLKEFYKDGKDRQGNTKYRRDCKWCYKKTRMQEQKLKDAKEQPKGGKKCDTRRPLNARRVAKKKI